MTAPTLELDGMSVPVEIGGTARRATLTVERDGSLRLRAAPDVEQTELREFLISKREWIYRKLAEKEALLQEPATKELVDGEGFLYLGRSYRLRIADTSGDVRLHRGRLELPRSSLHAGDRAIINWYARCGTAWLQSHVRQWSTRLRVNVKRLEVTDLGHKWGSATNPGRIRIHWATMQLRPLLVDYVLAHELAHLREPHHGPSFWQLLARVMPDYDERKVDLAKEGIGLWFGHTTERY
ncbi:M48 family metallopeptidase [Saccharomonospora piscinae]|uniref:M48 family metallopeptidase n=1 Tax=Saccharomonospora piscinae TaxID=687388 RepID=UPI001FC98DF0|nr:SprT family zinc-dependent metalloprotease [Saccharomonospora piscinae]